MQLLTSPPFAHLHGLWWGDARDQPRADRIVPEEKITTTTKKTPSLGASAQTQPYPGHLSTPTLRKTAPSPPRGRVRMRGRAPTPLLSSCACATMIPRSRAPPSPPGLGVRAASFERAGKAVGEGGASGYSLHGCGKERRRRPRLKKAGAESAGAVSAETGRGHGGVAATLPWRGYAGGGRVAAA